MFDWLKAYKLKGQSSKVKAKDSLKLKGGRS